MQRFLSPFRVAVIVGVALSAVLVAWARWGAAEPPAPPTAPAAAGMVIYRDPATGELGTPPAGVLEPSPGTGPAVSPQLQTDDGWRETHDPRPGGGWKLEGPRLLSTMTATVGPDGKVAIDCVPGEGR